MNPTLHDLAQEHTSPQNDLNQWLSTQAQKLLQLNGKSFVILKAKADIILEVKERLGEEDSITAFAKRIGISRASFYNYLGFAKLMHGQDEKLAVLVTNTKAGVVYCIASIEDDVKRFEWRDRFLSGEYITKAVLPLKEADTPEPIPLTVRLRELKEGLQAIHIDAISFIASANIKPDELDAVYAEFNELAQLVQQMNGSYQQILQEHMAVDPQPNSILLPATEAVDGLSELANYVAIESSHLAPSELTLDEARSDSSTSLTELDVLQPAVQPLSNTASVTKALMTSQPSSYEWVQQQMAQARQNTPSDYHEAA